MNKPSIDMFTVYNKEYVGGMGATWGLKMTEND